MPRDERRRKAEGAELGDLVECGWLSASVRLGQRLDGFLKHHGLPLEYTIDDFDREGEASARLSPWRWRCEQAHLLMDDRDGRREAQMLNCPVLGTLRVLANAAEQGLTDLAAALERLRLTNFRADNRLFEQILSRAKST